MKKSDKTIVLMLIGILLAAASYFLVYKNLTADTEVMNADNAKLRKDVEYLQELADNKQKYLDDTAAMQAEIETIKAQFPAQYLPEDQILYVIATENTHDIVAQSIHMNEPEAIAVERVEAETVETTDAAEGEAQEVTAEAEAKPEIQLYETAVTTTVQASYTSIKDVIKQINTDKDRKSLNTLSLAFDSETGGLLGTLGFSMYSLTGTEAEYKTPTVDGVVYGTNDIFNSAQKKAAAAAAEAASADSE